MNSFLSVSFAVICAVATVSGDVSHLPEVKNQYGAPSSTVAPALAYKAQYSPSPVISNRGVNGQQTPTVYPTPATVNNAGAAPAYVNNIYPQSGFPASFAYSGYSSPLSAYSGSYPSAYSAGSYPSFYSAGAYPTAYSTGAYPSAYSTGAFPSSYSYANPSSSVSSNPSSVGQYTAYLGAPVAQYPAGPSYNHPTSSYPAVGSYPSQYPVQYPVGSYSAANYPTGYYPVENTQFSGQYPQTQISAVKQYANQPAYNYGQYNNGQYNKPAYSTNQQTTSSPAY